MYFTLTRDWTLFLLPTTSSLLPYSLAPRLGVGRGVSKAVGLGSREPMQSINSRCVSAESPACWSAIRPEWIKDHNRKKQMPWRATRMANIGVHKTSH